MATAQRHVDSDDCRSRCQAAIERGELTAAELLSKDLWEREHRASDLANLGSLIRQQGRLQEAVDLFLQHETSLSYHVGLSVNAANAFRANGQPERSIQLLEAAIQRHGRQSDLLHSLAKSQLAVRNAGTAASLLEELSLIEPTSFSVWFDLGVARSQIGQPEDALKAFDQAQSLDPKHAITAANRITLLKDLARLPEAREALERVQSQALNQRPLELAAAEAGLLMAEQKMEEAAAILSRLCVKQPEQPLHWLNLAASERGLRRTVRPDRIVRHGLTLHPEHHALSQALMQSLVERGQLDAAKRLIASIDLERICNNDLHLFNLQFLAASSDLLNEQERRDQAAQWEKQIAVQSQRLWMDHIRKPLGERRLRIGYLSSDYCNHPVSRFLLPVLQNHDRDAVEVWGLHTGPHWDGISEAIKTACEHWLDLRGCNDAIAARVIADQRLDVLVELGGFTGLSRIGICRHRPVRVQMSYLGYPGATYLQCLPWWIGDPVLFSTLPELDRNSHQLALVQGGYMTMPRPMSCPEPGRDAEEQFRFGSFNHGRKLTDETISLWSELLRATPKAELVLKSFSFIEVEEQTRIRKRFETGGVDPKRIVLLPWAKDHPTHLAQYNQIDLALDPIPYGGATTTAEALWMGVPVVCLQRKGMVGSLAASLLATANQAELIQHDPESYIQCAISFYQQGARLKEERQTLIDSVAASALNQPRRVSSELERIYRRATQKYDANDA